MMERTFTHLAGRTVHEVTQRGEDLFIYFTDGSYMEVHTKSWNWWAGDSNTVARTSEVK